MSDTADRQTDLIDALTLSIETFQRAEVQGDRSLAAQEAERATALVAALQSALGRAEADHTNHSTELEASLRNERLALFWEWEHERAALAARLRAGTGQLLANTVAELAACRALLEATPVEAVQPGLQALEEELRSELAQFRNLIWDLSPPLEQLVDLGLYACLRLYFQGYARQHGITVQLSHATESLRIPPELQLLVYRIIQVAVKQAHWQRGANRIEVTLSQGENDVRVHIVDNGRVARVQPERFPVFLDPRKLVQLVMGQTMEMAGEDSGMVTIFVIPIPVERDEG